MLCIIIYVYAIGYTSMEQQDQLSTNTLSGICIDLGNVLCTWCLLITIEKAKLLDKMSREITLEIEKLTRHKEGEFSIVDIHML